MQEMAAASNALNVGCTQLECADFESDANSEQTTGCSEDADTARTCDEHAKHMTIAEADLQSCLREGPIRAQEMNQPVQDSSSQDEQLLGQVLRQLPHSHSGLESTNQQSSPPEAALTPTSMQHLEAQVAHLAHALHAEQEARAEADSEAQQLRGQLQKVSQHAMQLNGKSAQLAQQSQQLIAADAELTHEYEQLSAENVELAQQVQTLLAEKAQMSQQAEIMVELASRQNLNVQALRGENALMAQQLEEVTAAKAESSEQAQTFSGSSDELSQQVEQLNAELAQQAESFEEAYSELSQHAKELESSNAAFRQEVASLQADKLEMAHELQRQYNVIQNATCIEDGTHKLRQEQAALVNQVEWLESNHNSTTNDQVQDVTVCHMQCVCLSLRTVAHITSEYTVHSPAKL